MTVAETAFAAIDFESAGVRPGGTEVAGADRTRRMRGPEITDSFGSFLATEEPITWSAQKVHGIRQEDLGGRADVAVALAGTEIPAGRALAGGAWRGRRRNDFCGPFRFMVFGPWVDTLKLARAVWPAQPSFALGDLSVALGAGGGTAGHSCRFPAGTTRFPMRWRRCCSCGGSFEKRTSAGAEADILLRPDDSPYHRHKSGR